MGLPGLQRECLKSGSDWDAAARSFEDEATAKLGRACGRAKVLREILRHMGREVAVVDMRAVSSIAKRLRVSVRNVRQHLSALEAGGWVLRVHKAGLRFEKQRGWATSAYIVPALLPAVALMPPSRQAKARAQLRAPRIAAALLASGHAPALQAARGNAANSQRTSPQSSPPNNRKTSSGMGAAHRSVEVSSSSAVTEISTVLPLPPRARSFPQDHAPSAVERAWLVPAEGVRSREAAPASGGPAPDAQPTPNARSRNEKAKRCPRHTYRPRPRLDVLAALEARGISRGDAARRVYAYDLIAAWRRMRSARSEPEGRKPRTRGLLSSAIREQDAMRLEHDAKRCREQRERGSGPPSER